MRAMTGLAERLPHVAAFPEALGTGLLLHTDVALDDGLSNCIDMFISTYEAALSRFKDDSTVGRMRTATHGGTFDFPDWHWVYLACTTSCLRRLMGPSTHAWARI